MDIDKVKAFLAKKENRIFPIKEEELRNIIQCLKNLETTWQK